MGGTHAGVAFRKGPQSYLSPEQRSMCDSGKGLKVSRLPGWGWGSPERAPQGQARQKPWKRTLGQLKAQIYPYPTPQRHCANGPDDNKWFCVATAASYTGWGQT